LADTVDTLVLRNSDTYYSARFTNYSDAGAGESAVAKIDVSTLTGPDGATTGWVNILEAHWSVKGGAVKVFFDASTDDEALVLSGDGYLDMTAMGGMKNPKSSGYTGDVLFTTSADWAANSSYNITLVCKKKA